MLPVLSYAECQPLVDEQYNIYITRAQQPSYTFIGDMIEEHERLRVIITIRRYVTARRHTGHRHSPPVIVVTALLDATCLRAMLLMLR